MDDDLRPSVLASKAGISMSYASEILSGSRSPSRALAIAIFQKVGRKYGALAGLSDADVATLARIEGAGLVEQQVAA